MRICVVSVGSTCTFPPETGINSVPLGSEATAPETSPNCQVAETAIADLPVGPVTPAAPAAPVKPVGPIGATSAPTMIL